MSVPREISEKKGKTNLERYMHHSTHWSTIYNNQDMAATQVSINRGIDKEDVVYMYRHTMEYYSAIK